MLTAHAASRSRLLDNWRGWAIIFVLLGHFAHLPGANLGRVGVELFFVLSGRLMADLLFVKRIALPTFFYRRFTRVLPVSLLFVLSAFLLFPGALQIGWQAALASAAMVVNYTQLVGIGSEVTDHYWSLCVEEHSYMALGLVAFALRRAPSWSGLRPAYVCLGLASLMFLNGFRLWHAHPDYYAVYWRSDVRAATIFASAGLRVLVVHGLPARLRASWIPLAAFVVGMMCNWNHVPDPVKYSLGSLLLAISINSLEQAAPLAQRFLSSKIVAWVGLISYSVYIWQQPFFYSIDRFGAWPMLAAAVGTAALSFYLYENPVRAKLNSLSWSSNQRRLTAK